MNILGFSKFSKDFIVLFEFGVPKLSVIIRPAWWNLKLNNNTNMQLAYVVYNKELRYLS